MKINRMKLWKVRIGIINAYVLCEYKEIAIREMLRKILGLDMPKGNILWKNDKQKFAFENATATEIPFYICKKVGKYWKLTKSN